CEMVGTLCELKMDKNAIAAGVLHDLYISDTVRKDIGRKFNGIVGELIEGYAEVDTISKQTKRFETEDEYIHMILSVAHDLNVVLLLIANRNYLLNSDTILSRPERRSLANKILKLYAPLAHRLGLGFHKAKMEDKAYEILHPVRYRELSGKLDERRFERERYLKRLLLRLKIELEKFGLKPELSGRTKNLVSVYRKMRRTHKPFQEIYDLLAVRAIVDTVPDCYKILAVVQQMYTPVMEEFDDYIQTPKINGYQSIHVLLADMDNIQFELQIRTIDMHQTAEFGVAAHWKYKEGNRKSDMDSYFSFLRKASSENGGELSKTPVENFFNLKLLQNDIFVLTPHGDLKKLPNGSTPIDFAFAVHRDVGLKCNGAKVNGQIVPFNHELKNGDRVEVLTANKSMVNQDWIKYAKSNKALVEIRRHHRKEMRNHSIKLGEEILPRIFRKYKLPWTNENLELLAEEAKQKSVEELYVAVGSGKISAQTLVHKFVEVEEEAEEEKTIEEKVVKKPSPKGIKVGGIDNLMVNFGKCCLPVPGDPIVGYITRGKGVTVHRAICRNIRQLKQEPEREIDVEWESAIDMKFAAGLKALITKTDNFIKEITPVFGSRNVTLVNYKFIGSGGVTHCMMVVEIPNLKELNNVKGSLGRLKTVKNVVRMQYSEFKSLLTSAPVSLGKIFK
ncbi:MAG: bifunctional (p)ppGpp synthetase/guanosine-3',5'-bis(diphosphate) 3'-pyrophosphohydrolase, partial [bacterium]|nr:bifunctional (p)ppGpp synthetase/guanosine-3',5'-bis(diphosphate) 3'-pyrophosphohydrolase [bacterium]